MFDEELRSLFSFVTDRFANNEHKVGSRCPDFDLLDGFGIADGYSPPSLVYVTWCVFRWV